MGRSWIFLGDANTGNVELDSDDFKRILGIDICRFRGIVNTFPPEPNIDPFNDYANGDIIDYQYTKKDEITDTENVYDEFYLYCAGHWILIQPSDDDAYKKLSRYPYEKNKI